MREDFIKENLELALAILSGPKREIISDRGNSTWQSSSGFRSMRYGSLGRDPKGSCLCVLLRLNFIILNWGRGAAINGFKQGHDIIIRHVIETDVDEMLRFRAGKYIRRLLKSFG